MDNQALTPVAEDIMPVLDESEIVESAALDEAAKQDEELAAVASMRGWQRIADKMRTDIEGFRTGMGMDIHSGTPLAEIGQKFVIASTVATTLQSYLDMVTSAQEVVSERRKG